MTLDRGILADPIEADALQGLAGTAVDPERFAAAQESAWGRLSPRRNRWADVHAFDVRAAELETRQSELMATLQQLHTKLAAAPAADQQALAEWQLAGARGTRPEPSVEGLERDIARHQADYASITLAVNRTFADKAEYVQKHRKRLRKEADRRREEAFVAALAAVDGLERAREALAEANNESTWAALYPDAALEEPVDFRMLTGARMEPLKRLLGITTQVDAQRLFEAIRADLQWVRDAATQSQKNALAGINPRELHNAAWPESPEGAPEIA